MVIASLTILLSFGVIRFDAYLEISRLKQNLVLDNFWPANLGSLTLSLWLSDHVESRSEIAEVTFIRLFHSCCWCFRLIALKSKALHL